MPGQSLPCGKDSVFICDIFTGSIFICSIFNCSQAGTEVKCLMGF